MLKNLKLDQLQIRVPEDEKGRYIAAAEKAGLKLSQWVRQVLGEAAEKVLGSFELVEIEEEDMEKRFEVVRMEIAKLELKPNDVLVVKVGNLSQQEHDKTEEYLKEILDPIGVKCILADSSIELSDVSQESTTTLGSAARIRFLHYRHGYWIDL